MTSAAQRDKPWVIYLPLFVTFLFGFILAAMLYPVLEAIK